MSPVQEKTALTAPVVWCLFSAILFGASTPASKDLLVDSFEPLTLAGLLYLGAGLFSLPFAIHKAKTPQNTTTANQLRLLGAVVFGGIIGPVALLYGLKHASAGSVSLLLNLETTATAILAYFYFKESLGFKGWIANVAVVAAGILLTIPDGFSMAPAAGLVLFGCFCWGLDNNLTAIIDGYRPSQITLAKGIVAGGFNVILGLLFENPSFAIQGTLLALSVGALAYGASTILYVKGAQQLGATRSQMLFATAPFWGLGISWAWLNEPVLGIQVAAAILMAFALSLLLRSGHGHSHVHLALSHTHSHRHDDGHHEHSHKGIPPGTWHTHEHSHEAQEHEHEHISDLHHRHEHDS